MVLDTLTKMLDRLFNEVINDTENKTHIPDSLTLSEWKKRETRCRIAALLEPLTEENDIYHLRQPKNLNRFLIFLFLLAILLTFKP